MNGRLTGPARVGPAGAVALSAAGALALLAVGVLAAGCAPAKAKPQFTPPSPSQQAPVAAEAGGACQLLDFDEVAKALGVRFDVAAATEQDTTYSCVLQSTGRSRPDLALTVADTTSDVAVFTETVAPKGAVTVEELGRVAYRSVGVDKRAAARAAEVGWLTGDAKLVILRYTCATGATKADASALAKRLVTLAKAVDAARS